jgi:hypothetical protein
MVVPLYRIDQIIGITSGTLSMTAPTAISNPTTATVSFEHGFGDSAFWAGIFTPDNGVTYNDFGSMITVISSGTPVFQTVGCNATCDPINLTITGYNYYNFVAGSGAAASVNYKVYLLAKDAMAQPINPIPTSQILQYQSSYNFQKLVLSGTLPLVVAAAATGSVSVVHGLGVVPKVRAYRTDAATPTVIEPIATDQVADPQVRIDDTTLTFYSDQTGIGAVGIDTLVYYRIYLDS